MDGVARIKRVEVSAVVRRADGCVEDLGVVASSEPATASHPSLSSRPGLVARLFSWLRSHRNVTVDDLERSE